MLTDIIIRIPETVEGPSAFQAIVEGSLKEFSMESSPKIKVVTCGIFRSVDIMNKCGKRTGFLNPSSDNRVGGSYTKLRVAALEEIICGLSTLIFEQNGDINPAVMDSDHWIAMNFEHSSGNYKLTDPLSGLGKLISQKCKSQNLFINWHPLVHWSSSNNLHVSFINEDQANQSMLLFKEFHPKLLKDKKTISFLHESVVTFLSQGLELSSELIKHICQFRIAELLGSKEITVNQEGVIIETKQKSWNEVTRQLTLWLSNTTPHTIVNIMKTALEL